MTKGKVKIKTVHPAPIAKDAGNVRVFKETPIEEQLDWGTDSAGDDHSDLDNEIAESAGLDTGMYHTSHLYDDWDNTDAHYEPDRRVVSPSFLESKTNISQQSLLWLAMSSLESKIDLINHHFASCLKCKGNADAVIYPPPHIPIKSDQTLSKNVYKVLH